MEDISKIKPENKIPKEIRGELTQETYAGDNSSNTFVSGDYEYNLLGPQGISGITRFGGFVYQDILRELQGRRGMGIYREMRDNDATIGAVMQAIESLIRSVEWHIEAQGTKKADRKAAEFIDTCFRDMDTPWNSTLSDIISFITFGYSLLELNYKLRKGKDSKYQDGYIGWKNWQIRAQETIWSWNFDRDNNVLGCTQLAAPDFQWRYIPMEKCIHFKAYNNLGNPEGRSMLRNAYRSWYFLTRITEIEGIGLEKDLTGIPILHLPPELMAGATDENDTEARRAYNNWVNIAKGLKKNSQTAVILPAVYDDDGHELYKIELLSNNITRKQYDTDQIIKRYQKEIAMTLLADFIMLGNNSQGSFALSDSKVSMFRQSLNFLLKVISETINKQAIEKLCKLNHFDNLTDYPIIVHSNIDAKSLQETANFIQQLAASNVIHTENDKSLEDAMRERADLPPRSTINDDKTIIVEGEHTNE